MTLRAASKPDAPPAASPKAAAAPRPPPGGAAVAAGPIDRNRFEDEFPVMFKFYSERGKLSEPQMTKVQEIQQRWKVGCVYWLTHDNQEIEIPEWVAVNVVVNNKQNLVRGSRICMSLNHTKGYGCNRLAEGMCSYVHECALCGETDHGVFQKRSNGAWVCTKLRKWYDEEARYKAGGFGDPRKHEDVLTDIAKQPRKPGVRKSQQTTSSVWGPPVGARTGVGSTLTASTSASSVSEQASTASPAQPGQPAPSGAHHGVKQDALELLPEAAVSTDSVPSSSATSRRGGRKAAGTKATAAASTAAGAAGSAAPASGGKGREAASAARVQPAATSALPGGGRGTAAAGSAQQQPKKDHPKQPQPKSQPQPKLQIQPKLQQPQQPEQQPEQGRERCTSPFAPHLRPPSQPPPPRLPANWKALWCDDHQAYYYWHTPTNVTTWEAPTSENAPVVELDGEKAACSEEVATSACSAGSTDNSSGFQSPIVIKEGCFVCTQHWRPQPGIESCMKVFQGEVLVVTWTDGEIGGWAYGHTAEDVTKTGYFPQGVLAEAHAPLRPRGVGEVCTVAKAFTAPEEVGGYMSIEPGQQIKVLHIEGAWAYVELLDPLRSVDQPQVGWVPSMFLSGLADKE